MAQYGMPTLSPLAHRAAGRTAPAPAKAKKPAPLPESTGKQEARSSTGRADTTDTVDTSVVSTSIQRLPLGENTLDQMDPSPSRPLSHDADGIIAIDAQGDLVLHVEHQTALTKLAQKYRVHSATLKSHSRYFASLLDGRFGESAKIEAQHTVLRQRYGSLSQTPSSELPLIRIEDIGRTSTIKSIEALCTDFFMILHGKDTIASPPVVNLANIAIVADRFDALEALRSYVARKRLIRAIDGKTSQKAEMGLTEERVRMRLLVAVLLDIAPWLDRYSARLITKGWVGREADEADAMWWTLPRNLEEELMSRREYILDMLQASTGQIVALYNSRERQCRLGYDSSAACDSFQLGEAIKFLSRSGILQVKGMLFDAGAAAGAYEGDIFTLIDSLRQAPEYQIDRNHTHCGIRGRLISMLDMVLDALHHIGICAECWITSRQDHAWADSKPALHWQSQSYRSRGLAHKDLHAQVKAMFTATNRDWSR